jgi:hypothetical protein
MSEKSESAQRGGSSKRAAHARLGAADGHDGASAAVEKAFAVDWANAGAASAARAAPIAAARADRAAWRSSFIPPAAASFRLKGIDGNLPPAS